MEERIIINNQEICNQIDRLLIQKGFKRQSIFNTVKGYTKEELSLVTTLYLECSETIEDLIHFPNLKVLKIKSEKRDTVIEENPFFINHISDFNVLSYLTNLEELTIVNDPTLKVLDLTKLSNLKKLKICNNKQLENMIGLDTLKNLNNILIYANKKEPQIDPISYLKNTKEAEKNYLDITMFYDMIKKDHRFKELYLHYTDNYETNLEFVEKVGIYNYYVPFRPSATIRLYKEAEDILNSISFKLKLGTKEKMKDLYKFARRKVVYDYETLDNRDTDSLDEANHNQILSYRMSLPNTSYSALVGRKTVCEGYANMLHLLYHMIGVESEIIYCSKPETFINGLNHAALKVKYHDTYYYQDPDPNWGKDEEEFFMVEKEEFSHTHILSASEKGSDIHDAKRYFK